jgi:hypothetical protein
MTKEIIIQFNDILLSFLIQLSPLIGTIYNNKLEQIIKINSILPIEKFLVYALPLRDKIISKDETYFTENIDKNNLDIDSNDFNITEILQLKNIYSNLDKNSKDNVWNIFNALLVLGEDYIKNKFI